MTLSLQDIKPEEIDALKKKSPSFETRAFSFSGSVYFYFCLLPANMRCPVKTYQSSQ